jgi:hypothetical protein
MNARMTACMHKTYHINAINRLTDNDVTVADDGRIQRRFNDSEETTGDIILHRSCYLHARTHSIAHAYRALIHVTRYKKGLIRRKKIPVHQRESTVSYHVSHERLITAVKWDRLHGKLNETSATARRRPTETQLIIQDNKPRPACLPKVSIK